MKRTITLTLALIACTFIAKAQFNIGINAGINTPQKSISDSLSILRSGYSFFIDPAYTLGQFTVTSKIGYQSFNIKNGFNAMARQRNYTAANGYALASNSPGFLNVALGAGYNLLPAGITDCGQQRPSLLIGAQFGVLKTVNAANLSVGYQGKETAYALVQSNKTLPYINTGLQIIYPVTNSLAIKSGVAYNATLNDMDFQQTSNGKAATINTSYSDLQFTFGLQFSFRGNKKTVNANAAKSNPLYQSSSTSGTNPLNEGQGLVAGQPIHGIVVKGGQNPHKRTADEVKPDSTTTDTSNPQARVDGSPIGGIVVKGGHNGVTTANSVTGSPIHGIVVKGGQNPHKRTADEVKPDSTTTDTSNPQARVDGSPIGGIVVKGGHNGVTTANSVDGSPIGGIVVKGGHNGVTQNDIKTENPVFNNPVGEPQPVLAESVTGQPIGGIVVKGDPHPHQLTTGNPIPGVVIKGGKNPGALITVLDNGKSISEKGIKRTIAPDANGKGIQEKGMKFKAVENPGTDPSVKSRSIVYLDDFIVNDPALLKQLGIDQLIIKKGGYDFDYSHNPNGDVTLHIAKAKIIHRDIAARNILLKGFDPETNTYFQYTIELVYSKGVADKIIISYKGISEKGIK